MNRLLVLVALVCFTPVALPQEKEKEKEKEVKTTFLSALKVGQSLSLTKDMAGRYQIVLLEELRVGLGYKVAEVGSDYVVLEDVSGATEMRLPLHSIREIVRHKGLRR